MVNLVQVTHRSGMDKKKEKKKEKKIYRAKIIS